jgi:hypothetical protein
LNLRKKRRWGFAKHITLHHAQRAERKLGKSEYTNLENQLPVSFWACRFLQRVQGRYKFCIIEEKKAHFDENAPICFAWLT